MVVAAATDAHPELILAAVEAGVPVFCEKPVAKTMAEGVAVARRVADRGVPIQIGYPRRFDQGFAAVRKAIAERRTRVGAHRALHDPGPGPAARAPTSPCPAASSATAASTTSTRCAGSPAGRSSRSTRPGRDRGDPVFADIGDVAFAATVLTLDDGARAVVSNSRYNARGHDVRMEVHGSVDSIAAGLDEGLPLRSAQPGVTFPGGTPYTFFMDRFADAFRAIARGVHRGGRGRRPSPCTIEDALETGWVAEAATLSLAEHRPVRIDEVREAARLTVSRRARDRSRTAGPAPGRAGGCPRCRARRRSGR